VPDSSNDTTARDQLLKLARDLPYLANAKSKPVSVVLAEAKAKLQAIEDSLGGERQPFQRITAAELATGKFDLTYLIDGVLVKDQPAGLVAPKKSLKTNISIDLAVSLATGGRFLGYYNVPEPKRMAMFSGESGMATIQETALRVCKAANVELASTGIIFCETLPRFGDPVNMEAFRRFLDADGIEVVIIDPVYLCLPCDINPANLFDIGRLLRSVSDVCREAGATPVLVHHLKKTVANPYVPGQLEDIGWAGFQEFFRQWLLINRREAYEPGSGMHRLWLSTGGSAGHSSLVGLDVYEGVFDPYGAIPRVWEVSVLKPKDVIASEALRQEDAKEEQAETRAKARQEASLRKLEEALAKRPEGDTLSGLADLAGMSRKRAREGLDELLERGKVTPCTVIKGSGNRENEGYRLANTNASTSSKELPA
jgi:hypothetical protein